MSAPFMPVYIGDYLRDTAHLDAAEHGAYLLLLFFYWSKGSLPDDDVQLARIARVSPRGWPRIKATIRPFFGAGWRHDRLEKDRLRYTQVSLSRATSGSLGGKAKARKLKEADLANAKDLPEQNPANQNQNHIGSLRDPLTEAKASAADAAQGSANSPRKTNGHPTGILPGFEPPPRVTKAEKMRALCYELGKEILKPEKAGQIVSRLHREKGDWDEVHAALVAAKKAEGDPQDYCWKIIHGPKKQPAGVYQEDYF